MFEKSKKPIMKNAIKVFAVVFAMAMFLSSCKKDWTCECTTTESTTGTVVTNSTTLTDLTKKDARDVCEQTITQGTITTECILK